MFMEKFGKALLKPAGVMGYRSNCSSVPLRVVINKRPRPSHRNIIIQEGLFGIAELKKIDGFAEIANQSVKMANFLLLEANSQNRTRKLLFIFDDLSNNLCKVADLAEFIRIAHPCIKFNSEAEKVTTMIANFMEQLNSNRHLYEILKTVITKGDSFPMSEEELHIAKQFLSDFEENGTHLPEIQRKKLVRVQEAISKLGIMFLTEATKPTEIENLIDNYYHNRYTTRKTDAKYSPYSIVRQRSYISTYEYDKKKEMILSCLLKQRQEFATMQNYKSYVDFVLRHNILNKRHQVSEFLERLQKKIHHFVKIDFEVLSSLKHMDVPLTKIEPWDISYYRHKIHYKLQLKENDYLPYFSLGTCIEGLNNIFTKLFGIELINEEIKPGESWWYSIYKLRVQSEKEGPLGYLYFDFFMRDGKPEVPRVSIIRSKKILKDGNSQLPIVVIMMNWGCCEWPILLTLPMLKQLFNQIGNALYPILQKSEFQYVIEGCRLPDVKEIPAKILEIFSSNVSVLKTFAFHHATQEPIPQDILKKWYLSKVMFSASHLQQNIFFAMLDQIYHGPHPLNNTTTEIYKTLHKLQCLYPYTPNIAAHLCCTDFVNKGGQMYTSILAEAIAACLWQKFFKENPFDRQNGEYFKNEFLGKIGTKPSKQILIDIFGEQPTPEMLACFLSRQIAEHYNDIIPFVKNHIVDIDVDT